MNDVNLFLMVCRFTIASAVFILDRRMEESPLPPNFRKIPQNIKKEVDILI